MLHGIIRVCDHKKELSSPNMHRVQALVVPASFRERIFKRSAKTKHDSRPPAFPVRVGYSPSTSSQYPNVKLSNLNVEVTAMVALVAVTVHAFVSPIAFRLPDSQRWKKEAKHSITLYPA